MLSVIGWINGILATSSVIFCFLFGSWTFYQGKKINAKYLKYASFCIGIGWLVYLGAFYDFFTILFTGNNMDNSQGQYALLNWMIMVLSAFPVLFISLGILIPEMKRLKIFLTVFLFTSVFLFEIFLIFDPLNNINFIYPDIPGQNLIYSHAKIPAPLFFSALGFILIMIIFCGFGFFYKSMHSEGIIKKKFRLVSIAILLYCFSVLIEALFPLGNFSIITKIGVLISGLFWYFGLREESIDPKRKFIEKEVEVAESMFRLYKKPDLITEEEITFHKEKKICLICKGNVGGFNIFLCNKCGALYCRNCAKSLSNLENQCWACNNPIDESMPIKPYETEREEKKILKGDTKKSEIT